MDSRLSMWLGPPAKWAAKSTGPEIGEGPRAWLCIGLFVCLFWSCGNFQTAGGPGGGQGCYHPGLADSPIRPAIPLPISLSCPPGRQHPHEGAQLGPRQREAVTQLCMAVQARAHPLLALRGLVSQGCVSLCPVFSSPHYCHRLWYLPINSRFPYLLPCSHHPQDPGTSTQLQPPGFGR